MKKEVYRLYKCTAHVEITRGIDDFKRVEIFSYNTLLFRYEYFNGEWVAALDRYPTITSMQHLRKAVTWLTENRHFAVSEMLDWMYRSTIREKKRFAEYRSIGCGMNAITFPKVNPLA